MSERVEDRMIEAEDLAFIEALCADNHQEVYWKGWVKLYTKHNAASKKERILVVTNFRIFTVKQGVLKRSTRQHFPIIELTEIICANEEENHIRLSFIGGDCIDIIADTVVEIAQAVIFAFRSIRYGIHDSHQPNIDLPASFYDGFLPPDPDTQDGLLAAYLAACDAIGTSQKLPVLDYFMACFETKDRTLDIGDCLGPVKQPSSNDIMSIAHALTYTHWFTEIISVDFPLKDDGLSALSAVFKSHLTKCVLVGTKAGKTGFHALANRLEGKHMLTYLNLSKNNIGDSGLQVICSALKESPQVLQSFCIQNCGFSSKGYKILSEFLCTPTWLKEIKVLDISENSAGKSGSTALADFIRRTESLEQLFAMRSDLNIEILLKGLHANENLFKNKLSTLNLSGNKLTKDCLPILCEILKNSSSLTHLYLVDMSAKYSLIVDVVRAALENKHGVRYWLEFTKNDMGPKGAKELSELFSEYKNKEFSIHTLVLNENNLGAEGVISIVDSLLGSNIHTLSIDANISTGLFSSKVKESGEAIAKFMNETPSLRELSVAGDGSYYLKNGGYPILEALKTNRSIRYLDISRNRLGDEGIAILAEALIVNKVLTSFTAERNKIGMKGLKDLHKAILQNSSLVDWAIPRSDIEEIFKKSSVKVIKELKAMMYDFDTVMERNIEMQKESKENIDFEPDEYQRRRKDTIRKMYRKGKRHSRHASNMIDEFSKNGDNQEDSKDNQEEVNVNEEENANS